MTQPADPREVLSRPAPPPDVVLHYGEHPDQVADLRLPVDHVNVIDTPLPRPAGLVKGEYGAPGPPHTDIPPPLAPLLVLLHGGFWRQEHDRGQLGPMATTLAEAGWAVVTPEYRRIGGAGGWPDTFDDIARAIDRLPGLVAETAAARGVRVGRRYVLAGHSAGGHLALWAAARHRLPPGSPWRRDAGDPALGAVVALAAVGALAEAALLGLGGGATVALLGGGPAAVPDRYTQADPCALLPTGVPTLLLHGTADEQVPVAIAFAFADAAREQGDLPDLRVLPGAEHFGLIDPLSPTFAEVRAGLDALTG